MLLNTELVPGCFFGSARGTVAPVGCCSDPENLGGNCQSSEIRTVLCACVLSGVRAPSFHQLVQVAHDPEH